MRLSNMKYMNGGKKKRFRKRIYDINRSLWFKAFFKDRTTSLILRSVVKKIIDKYELVNIIVLVLDE